MNVVDEQGRLFGRVNLVDFLAAAFVLLLLPLAYGSYLLFRPDRPRIDSVSLAEISREERRVGSSLLRTKLKVKGTGFNPLLRAQVGDTQALGFVFETPNSADVLVGPIGPGAHDLVLYDGVQEVARAAGSVVIQAEVASFVRAVGWLTQMDAGFARTIGVGYAAPEPSPLFRILAIGPPGPARSRVSLATSHVDLPLRGRVEREVVVELRCDAPMDANPCNTNGRPLVELAPFVVSLPGALRLEVLELLPPTAPRQVRIDVGVTPISDRWPRAGDRDAFLDERAAVIAAVSSRSGGGRTVEIEVGADESREGWRYRSQLLRPGARFTMSTAQYVLEGTILRVAVAPPTVEKQ